MVMKSESKRQLNTKDDLRHIGDICIYIVQFVNSPPSVQHSFLARGEGGDIERVYDPQLGKGWL